MMRPPPPCLMNCIAASFEQRNTDLRFTAIVRSHASSGMLMIGIGGLPMPALLTSMSSRPKRSIVSSKKRWTSALLLTSPCSVMCSTPVPLASSILRRLVEVRLLDVDERELRALAREPQRHAAPDAASAAGDDRDPVLQQHLSVLSAVISRDVARSVGSVASGSSGSLRLDRAAALLP